MIKRFCRVGEYAWWYTSRQTYLPRCLRNAAYSYMKWLQLAFMTAVQDELDMVSLCYITCINTETSGNLNRKIILGRKIISGRLPCFDPAWRIERTWYIKCKVANGRLLTFAMVWQDTSIRNSIMNSVHGNMQKKHQSPWWKITVKFEWLIRATSSRERVHASPFTSQIYSVHTPNLVSNLGTVNHQNYFQLKAAHSCTATAHTLLRSCSSLLMAASWLLMLWSGLIVVCSGLIMTKSCCFGPADAHLPASFLGLILAPYYFTFPSRYWQLYKNLQDDISMAVSEVDELIWAYDAAKFNEYRWHASAIFGAWAKLSP